MKRIALLIALVLTAGIAVTQNSAVQNAYNYMKQGKYDKAKEYADKSVEHHKTSTDAKAWYYRGNVYLSIAASQDEEFQNLDPDPLAKALESFKKVLEYDEKERYVEEIPPRIKAVAQEYYNQAVTKYNEQDFKQAALNFERAFEVNKEIDFTDTTALFNAAVSATLGKDTEGAIKYYNMLREMDYPKAEVYSSLSEAYSSIGDTVSALDVLAQGREKFPKNFDLLILETNIYLAKNNMEKALENLEMAIEQDKTNPTIFFAVGTTYDQLGMFDNAEESYDKAIELKPDYFEAHYNLGALYVNKAAELQQQANDLPLDDVEGYDKLKAEADDLLKKSLPHLEKALEMEPDDTNTLISLKEIYTRLNMMEKLKEVDAKLGQ
jgi:tetratricopeptide (TPR) repeat protein